LLHFPRIDFAAQLLSLNFKIKNFSLQVHVAAENVNPAESRRPDASKLTKVG